MSPENKPLQLPEPISQSSEIPNGTLAMPHGAAEFRTLPKDAESYGTVPQAPERKESHTLTVRETARMFEAAGVSRTERSIINWCQPNRQGVARLDAYFDPNERRYYISPQSVELAISEEKLKAIKNNGLSELDTNVPKDSKDVFDQNELTRAKEYELQLLLYAFVFQRLYGEAPIKGVLYFSSIEETFEFDYTPSAITAFEKTLNDNFKKSIEIPR